MADSDSLYHRLFSHPQMVEGLVREFAPRELAAGLDFSGLRRVNAKFRLNRRSIRRRASDVIWRVPTREGKHVHFYLLIEFQSQSDAWMAVRTQVYQGLLWQQIIDEQELYSGSLLPPLALLVLYNGERPWKAATKTSELIALSSDSTLWSWQPGVRYCLLDVGRIPQAELARRSSLVALLFRLEQQHSPEQFEGLLNEVIGWFRQHPGYERLQGLFMELIHKTLAVRGVELSRGGNLLEMMNMKTMFLSKMDDWKKKLLAEGEAKGKAEALISLLAVRFGVIAPSWRKRIRGAELKTLERWFKRAIVAPDMRSVFDRPR